MCETECREARSECDERGAGGGQASGVRIELDPGGTLANLDAVRACRNVAEEARARCEVEAPLVVRADERLADDIPVDQRIALVGTLVLDGVDRLADAKDRDRPPAHSHERAAVAVEDIDRNRDPVAHAA